MRNLLLVLTSLSSIFSSAMAYAHPGHDHSQWSSDIIHGVLFLGVASLGALAAFFIKQKLNNKKNQKDSNNAA